MDNYRRHDSEDDDQEQEEWERDEDSEEISESEPPRFTDEDIAKFILARLKAGDDKASMVKYLTDQGLRSADASYLVETHYSRIVARVARQQYRSEALPPAIAGGVLAAVVGGIIWGVVSVVTDREIGIMAWAIGWLTGYAVLLFAGKRRGLPLQLVAVVTAILGIAIGKYVAFAYQFMDIVGDAYGEEVAGELSIFSEEVFLQFIENIEMVASMHDILWIILAVVTAWGIPKGSGIKLPEIGYYPYMG
ncbi:MAG: hypothetical protein JW763_06410 [candidate division Zixibacteria bacterium]|nr:hypothetical protein [candidate division Zixibacteria bacterium]